MNDALARYDFTNFVCTDPDELQFACQENEHCWWFIQVIDARILDLYEGKPDDLAKAYKEGLIVGGIDVRRAINGISTISASIDLYDYTEKEIKNSYHSFDYSDDLDDIFLKCECLFENNMFELIENEQIELIRLP